jgi:hypothetical protein
MRPRPGQGLAAHGFFGDLGQEAMVASTVDGTEFGRRKNQATLSPGPRAAMRRRPGQGPATHGFLGDLGREAMVASTVDGREFGCRRTQAMLSPGRRAVLRPRADAPADGIEAL